MTKKDFLTITSQGFSTPILFTNGKEGDLLWKVSEKSDEITNSLGKEVFKIYGQMPSDYRYVIVEEQEDGNIKFRELKIENAKSN